ncbi:MAG: DUF4760 domain-containing protein [Candidatus Eremiobacteraeota bacterium]|nr:DUF4760 domain-containing protein [Candidatus Eremiobacteraeota bacterium]MBV8365595.1 DUF4760 domain-containing protein [Candidatus Eremiobacteraeota bacterium]
MSLELVNTFATLGTFIVIAATAIAALVQLRHLRAGNQVTAMISIGNQFDDKTFREAVYLVPKVTEALENEDFRNLIVAISRRRPRPQVPQEITDLNRALVLVGNFYEELGILVKNEAIDKDLVLDRWSANITGAWERMARYIAWARKCSNSDLVYENFEYLVVLAEDWLERYAGGTYPKGMRRLTMPDTWPFPPDTD